MDATLQILTAYLAYNSPIVIALLWVKFTSLGSVKRLMLFYAKAHFATITFVSLYSFAIESLCDGSLLKGYVRCSIVPLEMAKLTLPILLIALAGLAVSALIVAINCGVKELRKTKNSEH